MKASVKTLVFAAMAVGMVHADQINFVAGIWTPLPPGFSGHNTNAYMRDLTLVPLTNGITGYGFSLYGVTTPNSVSYPPTTNVFNVNLAAGELQNAYSLACYVGMKNGVSGSGTGGAGKFLIAVGGATGRKGYCRMFSAMTPTSAAYYANSGLENLLGSALGKSIGANMVADKINPAYLGLNFDGFPYKYLNGSDNMISGSVNTTVSGGNNTLSNGAVLVYWRATSGDAWAALENFTISGDGDFAGKYAGGTEVMIGMAGGVAGAMPNSMLNGAQGALIPIPEPGALFAVVGGLCVVLRKK